MYTKVTRRNFFEVLGAIELGCVFSKPSEATIVDTKNGFANGLKNLNERIYPVEIWKDIEANMDSRHYGYVELGLSSESTLIISSICGKLVDYRLDTTDSGYEVFAKVQALSTPIGITLKGLTLNKIPLYLTPVGSGNLIDDVVTNYKFSHWALTNNSTFINASPVEIIL